MAELRWTLEAARWLEEVYDYIAADNSLAAQRTVHGIYDKAQLLKAHPRLGYRHEPIGDREVRILLYGHYRIAYLVHSEKAVDILGVFHAAMDLDRYLQ